MTDTPETPQAPEASQAPAAADDYVVVLLVEQQLTDLDAAQVRSLHESIEERVAYHVILPVDDAAARVEASLGSMSGGDLLTSPAVPLTEVDLEAVEESARHRATEQLRGTIAALEGAGAKVAGGTLVGGSPVDELAAKVSEVDGAEAIVLTQPHVVAELFHLDWTSQARRKLGVPVLHLLEHQTFDEQAEGL